jgi:hypothetical protein
MSTEAQSLGCQTYLDKSIFATSENESSGERFPDLAHPSQEALMIGNDHVGDAQCGLDVLLGIASKI